MEMGVSRGEGKRIKEKGQRKIRISRPDESGARNDGARQHHAHGGEAKSPHQRRASLNPSLAKGEGKMNGEEMAGAVARPTEKKEQGGNKSRPYVQAIRLKAESGKLNAKS